MPNNTIKNECAKTRKVNDPYEIYIAPGWEWRVLKKYQRPELEAKNPYAIWFCAVKGPGTFGNYDMGDTYAKDIISYGRKLTKDETVSWLKDQANKWHQY